MLQMAQVTFSCEIGLKNEVKTTVIFACIAAVCLHSSKSDVSKGEPELLPDTVISGSNLAIPDNTAKAEYQILMFGNSHVSGLAGILNTLITQGVPSKSVTILTASSQHYLIERLNDDTSLEILKNDTWSHVILQAQKYSQSGVVDYPTDGAQRWSQLAKEQDATPILFPEHPQRGNKVEGQRLYDLHQSIAAKQSACVAAIGPVWDKVLALRPELVLHHVDGNHASELGKLLTALVFYQIISGNSADLLPYIASLDAALETQDFFGQIVSQVLTQHPACKFE